MTTGQSKYERGLCPIKTPDPVWRELHKEFEEGGTDPGVFASLVINEDTTNDEVLERWIYFLDQKAHLTDLFNFLKQQIILWCEKNGKLTFSEDRYWFAGVEKRTKCRNAGKVIERLLVLTGGDFDAVVGALPSNAIKPGYVKKLLERETPETAEEEFDLLFEQVEVSELKEKKGSKKSLIEVDKRFVR